ncbi:MAG: carboxypeptidase-like regulatory domain-containing protein [Acidobacteriota bacterium]|nr:carboxypeptidase-like regulatory domain-containing protein [Acidobacteriota bacterium]
MASIALATTPLTAGTASISGLVVAHPARAALEGAVVGALERGSTSFYRSAPTDADGAFRLDGLPPGRYALAVEVDRGVFLSEASVPLQSGERRVVQVAVSEDSDSDPDPAAPVTAKSKGNPWDNPVTATLIVIGGAVVVGLLLKEVGESGESPPVSPMSPS